MGPPPPARNPYPNRDRGKGLGASAGNYYKNGPPAPPPPEPWQRVLGRGVYDTAMAGADADAAMAETDWAKAQRDYGWDIAGIQNKRGYEEGLYGTGKAGLGIQLAGYNRQGGYLGDMRNIDAWRTVGDVRGIDIQNAANERQFGLINAARGDVGANRDRELERLTDVQAGIGDQEAASKRQEKQAQWKAFSDAAASGNISTVAQMNSGELRSSLKDNLAEFQRQRAQAKRDTDQANQDYATKMRDLQEQEATATDARELGKIRREMRMLDEQASKRKYQEDLAQLEDQKQENFLSLMNLEYKRKYDLENGRISWGQADSGRQYGSGVYDANMAKVAVNRRTAENEWFNNQNLYPK